MKRLGLMGMLLGLALSFTACGGGAPDLTADERAKMRSEVLADRNAGTASPDCLQSCADEEDNCSSWSVSKNDVCWCLFEYKSCKHYCTYGSYLNGPSGCGGVPK